MTMLCTLRLHLVILLAGFRPHLQLEAGLSEQIPQAADSRKQLGSCVLVPCRASRLGRGTTAAAAESHQQQQQASSSLM